MSEPAITEPNPFGGTGGFEGAANLFGSGDGTSLGGAGDSGDNSGGSGGDSGDDRTFDPERHISPDKRNADGSYRRKRAKRGTGNSAPSKPRTAKADRLGVEGLTRMLVIIHAGIAATTKTEEMVIDEGEAQMLAASTANLLEQFDIRPDPKIEAAIGLITAASIVYGPRVIAIRNRKKMEAATQQE